MTTFLASQDLINQQHFTVVEIDLPVVEGTCTVLGQPGYGTPLSCDQSSNATRTYKFTTTDAPILHGSILRYIDNISETTAKLQSGRGLASRGGGSISLIDFNGDPNPDAPAVDSAVIDQGTFLSKLDARQILDNKPLRIKNYRVESDGTVDLATGAETRHYIIESFNSTGVGKWNIRFKDELSRINVGDSVWPLPLEGSARTSFNAAALTIDVDANVTYLVGDTVRIGDELIKISAVANIGTGTATISTAARGADIVYTNTLSTTTADSHDAGDEIFVCDVSDDETIDDLLERVLLDIGVPAARIPKADWAAEVLEWHPTTKINTLWIESEDTNDVLEKILTNFQIDMWFDPVAREVKLSAISVWKESSITLSEGDQIDFESIKRVRAENLRSTRAYVVYDKPALATSESIENYKKASLFKRTDFEDPDLFGEPKTKRFDFTPLLSSDAASLLTNRWVSRYINPFAYNWTTPERKRLFDVGDIVDLETSLTLGFNGLSSGTDRAQITSIRPKYGRHGREYAVSALIYEPVFASGSEVVITGNISDVNLFIQYAGAPSSAVTITFVFDNVNSGSSASNLASIRAGAFPIGSKIIIILANGSDLQAKGGDAGNGGSLLWKASSSTWVPFPPPENGVAGATVYDAEGIDTDIYFSGATPSTSFPTALGSIKAPNGGDGGFDASFLPGVEFTGVGGDGGDGGDGRSIGLGGAGGTVTGTVLGTDGSDGANGVENSILLGQAGANNNALGGAAGSGVIDNGATVVFFGDTTSNYVNGGGDH